MHAARCSIRDPINKQLAARKRQEHEKSVTRIYRIARYRMLVFQPFR